MMNAPQLLRKEVLLARMIEQELFQYAYDSKEEYNKVFDSTLAFYRRFGTEMIVKWDAAKKYVEASVSSQRD
jgi:hypothetical protein